MIKFKHRWSTAFGGSLLFHGGGFLIVALLAGFFISSIPKQGPIEVDLIAGGGGGGGASAIQSAAPSSASPPPEQITEEAKEVFDDIHEIEKEYTESTQSNPVQNSTSTNRNTSMSSSASGTGTGSGSGNGSGQGSGTGSGSGSGVGSGTGSGYGSGTGAGVGEGEGNTVGPQVLNTVEPVFPESERTAGSSGTAMVGLTIDVDGSVSSAWIESSTGSTVLDDAAVSAVYQWRFIPAKRGGVPIQSRSRVPIIFKYRN